MSGTIYTEVKGTTAYVNGERGTVVHLAHSSGAGKPTAAFVRLAERPAMLYVHLGASSGDRNQHQEVTEAHEITRDEFDVLTGLAQVRRDMGWDL